MKQYKDLLREILARGEGHNDRTGTGTFSLFGEQLKLDLKQGFPLVTTKKIPFRWIATELFWMLAGSTNELELKEKGVHTWAPWATKEACEAKGRQEGDLGPTYGFLMRHFGMNYMPTLSRRLLARQQPDMILGHDQIWELCVGLDTDPHSRRHIVSHWDPVSVHEVTVPPCQPLWQVRLHDETDLSLRVDVRSQDAFIGLPFDMAHYALLAHMLAYCTCRRPRWLVMQFGDLHIYKSHLPQVNELLKREPRELPQLTIDKPMYHAQPPAPGRDTFINLLQIGFDHLRLEGYDPHPKLSAEVAV